MHIERGVALYFFGKHKTEELKKEIYNQSINSFSKAIGIEPQNFYANFNKALMLSIPNISTYILIDQKSLYEELIRCYDSAFNNEEENPDFFYNKAILSCIKAERNHHNLNLQQKYCSNAVEYFDIAITKTDISLKPQMCNKKCTALHKLMNNDLVHREVQVIIREELMKALDEIKAITPKNSNTDYCLLYDDLSSEAQLNLVHDTLTTDKVTITGAQKMNVESDLCD